MQWVPVFIVLCRHENIYERTIRPLYIDNHHNQSVGKAFPGRKTCCLANRPGIVLNSKQNVTESGVVCVGVRFDALFRRKNELWALHYSEERHNNFEKNEDDDDPLKDLGALRFEPGDDEGT